MTLGQKTSPASSSPLRPRTCSTSMRTSLTTRNAKPPRVLLRPRRRPLKPPRRQPQRRLRQRKRPIGQIDIQWLPWPQRRLLRPLRRSLKRLGRTTGRLRRAITKAKRRTRKQAKQRLLCAMRAFPTTASSRSGGTSTTRGKRRRSPTATRSLSSWPSTSATSATPTRSC